MLTKQEVVTLRTHKDSQDGGMSGIVMTTALLSINISITGLQSNCWTQQQTNSSSIQPTGGALINTCTVLGTLANLTQPSHIVRLYDPNTPTNVLM